MDIEVEQHVIIELPEGNVMCEYSRDFPEKAIIHCDIYEWTPSKFKTYLDVWEDIIEAMKARGIKELIMSANVTNKKLIRFAMMFGFELGDDVTINNEEHIMMTMELV